MISYASERQSMRTLVGDNTFLYFIMVLTKWFQGYKWTENILFFYLTAPVDFCAIFVLQFIQYLCHNDG